MKQKIIKAAVIVLQIVASIGVILSGLLHVLDVWQDAGKLYLPLSSVILFCNAYALWNRERKFAYVEIGMASVILIVSILLFVI